MCAAPALSPTRRLGALGCSPRRTAETLADVQGWEAEIRGQVARAVVAGESGITVPDAFRLPVDRRASTSVHFTD